MTTKEEYTRAAEIARRAHDILLTTGRSEGPGWDEDDPDTPIPDEVCGPVCVQVALSVACFGNLGHHWAIFDRESTEEDLLGPEGVAVRDEMYRLLDERLEMKYGPDAWCVNDTPLAYGLDEDKADDFWFDLLVDTEKGLLQRAGEVK